MSILSYTFFLKNLPDEEKFCCDMYISMALCAREWKLLKYIAVYWNVRLTWDQIECSSESKSAAKCVSKCGKNFESVSLCGDSVCLYSIILVETAWNLPKVDVFSPPKIWYWCAKDVCWLNRTKFSQNCLFSHPRQTGKQLAVSS